MPTLLRFRASTRTVRLDLPDGSHRLVKVTTNDAGDTQHVEDGDVIHGTGRPAPVVIKLRQPSKQRRGLLLRNMGMPKMRQAWKPCEDTGLWAPIHGSEVAR
jgi:hypothetical protein